jgi:hypothetical protein
MCPFAHRLIATILGAVLLSCGGGSLTLPGNTGPAELAAYSGNGQEGTVGDQLAQPLVVLLTDADSQPVAGVSVVFGFESDIPEAKVYPEEAVTDSAGLAEAKVRLGAIAGTHIVEAQISEGLRATFELTAVPEEKGKKGKRGDRDHDDDDDDEDD